MKARHPWRPPWKAALAALVCGAAASPAFPPLDWWPLGPLVLAPLLLLAGSLRPRQAATAGWLWGLGMSGACFYWLMVVMITYGHMSWPLALGALGLLAAYLSLYPMAFAALLGYTGRAGLSPLWVAPAAWAGLEFLRGHLLTGFPWLPLSASLTAYPPMLQTAEWWGATGLSAVLALAAALLATAIGPLLRRQRPSRGQAAAALAGVALLAGLWGWGVWRQGQVEADCARAPHMAVGVVQANIPLEHLWNRAYRADTMARHLRLSGQAMQADPRPELLVWPESAAPFYFLLDARPSQPVLDFARERAVHITLGSLGVVREDGSNKTSNRAWLVRPEGPRLDDYYDKVHLVPFGEYVPLGKILFFVRSIAAVGQDQAFGDQGKVIRINHASLGPLICYESIFPELARDQRLAGANLLVNQTNDAWFGRTGASAQHLSHLVLRAVENRVSCARAANTGISCFVLPTGRVSRPTDLFVEAYRTENLPVCDKLSQFSQWGDWAGPLGCLAALAAALLAWRRNRRRDKGEV